MLRRLWPAGRPDAASPDQSNAQQIDPTSGSVDGGVDQVERSSRATPARTSTRPSRAPSWSSAGACTSGPTRSPGTVQANDALGRRQPHRSRAGGSVQPADGEHQPRRSIRASPAPPLRHLSAGPTRRVRAWRRASRRSTACGVCSDALSDASVGLVGGDLHQNDGAQQSTAGVLRRARKPGPVVQPELGRWTRPTIRRSRAGIVIGNVSQANVQDANVDQSIDQSLSGTYLVFGTLDQSADQLALINQSNHQNQGG